jgi:type I site-specific restriction endonuclease
MSKNRYKRLFKLDDFDLVISDEAYRSISGNSRMAGLLTAHIVWAEKNNVGQLVY